MGQGENISSTWQPAPLLDSGSDSSLSKVEVVNLRSFIRGYKKGGYTVCCLSLVEASASDTINDRQVANGGHPCNADGLLNFTHRTSYGTKG